jgi:predicted amidohydrolase
MKICLAQFKPVKGDITINIDNHAKMIHLAADHGAHLIIFPELSITGYEPTLANNLAIDADDSSLDSLQEISNTKHIAIAAGMPVKNDTGITISLIVFQPHQPREIYSKQYLHADEIPFFINGEPHTVSLFKKHHIGMAICYEISVPEHASMAHAAGAQMYIASVAKSVKGVEKALVELPAIARKYSMPVLMADCVGHCDDFDCGGKSSVWNASGELLAQLNGVDKGLLMYDTESGQAIAI